MSRTPLVPPLDQLIDAARTTRLDTGHGITTHDDLLRALRRTTTHAARAARGTREPLHAHLIRLIDQLCDIVEYCDPGGVQRRFHALQGPRALRDCAAAEPTPGLLESHRDGLHELHARTLLDHASGTLTHPTLERLADDAWIALRLSANMARATGGDPERLWYRVIRHRARVGQRDSSSSARRSCAS